MFKNIVSVGFIALLWVLGSFTTLERSRYKLKTIVIDAGHGGKDPGCLGAKSKEGNVTLQIALELGRTINTYMPDVKVIYTRKTNVFVELHDRAAIANKNNADLFISIHCNAGPKHIYGSETYTMGLHTSKGNLEVAKRENDVVLQEDDYLQKYEGFDPKSPLAHIFFAQVQNAHLASSLLLAEKIEHQFKKRVGRNSRGVKQAGFLVLWRTAMPSVLIETGYLTNREEEKYLNNDLGQTYLASGIYRAIRDYREEMEKGS